MLYFLTVTFFESPYMANLIAFFALVVAGWPYVSSFCNKLNLDIVLPKDAQLRIDHSNSLFGLNILLNTKNMEGFIENIELSIRHEQGKNVKFNWLQIIERVSTLTATGALITEDKVTSPLGYKFAKNSSFQLGLLFNDILYEEIYSNLSTKLTELRFSKYYESCELLEQNELFIDLIDNIDKNLNWASGHYYCTLVINCTSSVFSKEFQFFISRDTSTVIRDFNLVVAKSELSDFFIREKENKLNLKEKYQGAENPFYLKIVS